MMSERPSLVDIVLAVNRIRSKLCVTPVVTSTCLNDLTGRNIYLKCENLHKTGSFKCRGALNTVIKALENKEISISGFVTHSSGNHGQALAWSAKSVNLPCSVVVPVGTPLVKTNAIESYNAELVLCPPTPAARLETCNKIGHEKNYMIVPPFDHPDVIAGQGTIAVEFLKQVEDLDAIFVPVSGGGMISGIAIYAKQINPNIRIYACVPEGKMLSECLKSCERLWPNPPAFLNTKAEAIRLQQCGEITFPIMCDLVEKEVFTIDDASMIAATKFAFERLKLVVELASGCALAAILSDQLKTLDKNIKNIGVILCGGNIDINKLPWIENETKTKDI
ncbi:unnamed protein product [Didymodactylos carnosus]|uniref:Tryptophan synthase beta chain-like PALP domain-containing protein n=1 Tax=Didymodactylos carnosus TaxID=1234261 RepID=A0A813ZRI6_9BILA|nr:unnamed protein product [Didymodactylos carnosus]CAF0928574.1 unnamed protein product [Didymodactylos carnosus]CAF3685574.1 unnamed protein product [Didymodactylos carnosus]CAF3705468.1 unnamed protein product [Didymodactylos carnosus]